MVQWLRVLVLSIHMGAHNDLYFQSQETQYTLLTSKGTRHPCFTGRLESMNDVEELTTLVRLRAGKGWAEEHKR